VNAFFHPLKVGMRSAGGLFFVLLCLASRAQGQVSVDMRALDSLGSPGAHVVPAPARPVVVPRRPVARTATVTNTPKPAPPVVVTGPPAPALPTEQPAAPPAVAMVPAPAPSTEPLPPPVRLVFDSGKTDLTPDEEAAIRDLAHAIPAPAVSSVNVVAYAAGKPDDPSTARRLSLSRGMAVRSVLLASGVPSAQIYVRALGATASDGPADRVELTVARIGTVTR
jgi:outer membrane protein OmpA-like peptidoglycan-associated protein